MNRVIFYKTAKCPSCGKLATFDMETKWKKVCKCCTLKPDNKVKAIIVKEVAK